MIRTLPEPASAHSIWHLPLAKIYILLPVKPIRIIASFGPNIAKDKNSERLYIKTKIKKKRKKKCQQKYYT